MFYSVDRIPGEEDLAAQKRLDALRSYKLKREYYEMCGFVRVRIPLAIARFNRLIFRCPWDKVERIRQQPELTDGVVMSLIAPW